jgi:hypothetical protein
MLLIFLSDRNRNENVQISRSIRSHMRDGQKKQIYYVLENNPTQKQNLQKKNT